MPKTVITSSGKSIIWWCLKWNQLSSFQALIIETFVSPHGISWTGEKNGNDFLICIVYFLKSRQPEFPRIVTCGLYHQPEKYFFLQFWSGRDNSTTSRTGSWLSSQENTCEQARQVKVTEESRIFPVSSEMPGCLLHCPSAHSQANPTEVWMWAFNPQMAILL